LNRKKTARPVRDQIEHEIAVVSAELEAVADWISSRPAHPVIAATLTDERERLLDRVATLRDEREVMAWLNHQPCAW
jgi:hypothetical protein